MSEIITPKAPAILKGPQAVDTYNLLSKATPEQVAALTYTNFALWAAKSGIEVDGRKFDFDSHRYLLPIYLDTHPEIVWQKAAQLGATIYMLLRLLWYTRYHQIKAGLFFPTADAVKNLSKDRLSSIIKSNRELEGNLADGQESLALKQMNNIYSKVSSLYMLYLGGQSSKDSVPLDIIAFDEVRLVNAKDIDQALERVSHSTYKVKMFVSTCGAPGTDINLRFVKGTQHTWHVKCSCRSGGFVPSEVFPDCIAETATEVYLRCPRCKTRIQDPQNGFYEALNPKADYHSYHVSQLCSRYITPKEIWEFYKRTTNMAEFYNSKLGLPYVNEDDRPINDTVLESCVNYDLRWGNDMSEKDRKQGTIAMGVDQHAGNVFVTIVKRTSDGKRQILHLEVVDRENPRYWENGKSVTPFKRLYELIREYNPAITVIDAMPNYNEAQDLARYFPGRVFLAFFGDTNAPDMVKWHDRLKPKEAIRKGSKEIKLKWQCTLLRYQIIDFTLRQFAEQRVVMPDPRSLTQVVRNPESGIFQVEPICQDWYWKHLKTPFRFKEMVDEETGKFRMVWKYAGSDPHFCFSTVYAFVGLERAKRQAIFVI